MNPSQITEHQFQKWILESFDGHRNIMLFRRNTGAAKIGERFIRFSEAGQSDIWGIIKEYRCPRCNRLQWGVHFEIELKVGKNKLSAPQEQWIRKVAEFNGNALVLRPDGNEPVGIVNRLERLLYSFICPDCVAKGKMEVA
jgi:hypothetical protein